MVGADEDRTTTQAVGGRFWEPLGRVDHTEILKWLMIWVIAQANDIRVLVCVYLLVKVHKWADGAGAKAQQPEADSPPAAPQGLLPTEGQCPTDQGKPLSDSSLWAEDERVPEDSEEHVRITTCRWTDEYGSRYILKTIGDRVNFPAAMAGVKNAFDRRVPGALDLRVAELDPQTYANSLPGYDSSEVPGDDQIREGVSGGTRRDWKDKLEYSTPAPSERLPKPSSAAVPRYGPRNEWTPPSTFTRRDNSAQKALQIMLPPVGGMTYDVCRGVLAAPNTFNDLIVEPVIYTPLRSRDAALAKWFFVRGATDENYSNGRPFWAIVFAHPNDFYVHFQRGKRERPEVKECQGGKDGYKEALDHAYWLLMDKPNEDIRRLFPSCQFALPEDEAVTKLYGDR